MTQQKLTRVHVIVTGRVQGVGYRAFVLRIAKGFSLKGYVKNMPDGTVQIEAEGTQEILDKFVITCKIGPGWAHIENINQTES